MKKHLNGNDIANEIRMTRSQHNGAFVMVEGATSDFRVYKRLIDNNVSKIMPAHNKDNVIQAIKILNQANFKGVVGIVDADFWHLEQKKPDNPNLFTTDTHDLETMLLESPALEKVLDEFGSVDKINEFVKKSGKSIRTVLLKTGCSLGYLRWVSLQQNLALTFEGLAFNRFVDNKTLALNITNLIKTVKNKSQKHNLNEQDLEQSIDAVKDTNHNRWDVCCGHDLICILSLGLQKTLGSNKAKDVDVALLEKFLRVAYEYAYFLNTQLYQSLKSWEEYNQPFKIFPQDTI